MSLKRRTSSHPGVSDLKGQTHNATLGSSNDVILQPIEVSFLVVDILDTSLFHAYYNHVSISAWDAKQTSVEVDDISTNNFPYKSS